MIFFCSVSPQSDSCCLLNGTLLILNILSVASVQETFHNLKAPKRAERVIEAMEPTYRLQTNCLVLISLLFLVMFDSVLEVTDSGEENATAVEGDDALLVCEVEGNPTPWVTWTAPTGTVLQNGTWDTNLTLHNVTRGNSGTYVCNATNKLASDSKYVLLDVQCEFPSLLFQNMLNSLVFQNCSILQFSNTVYITVWATQIGESETERMPGRRLRQGSQVRRHSSGLSVVDGQEYV